MVDAQGSDADALIIMALHRRAASGEHRTVTCGIADPSGRRTTASSTCTTCSITES